MSETPAGATGPTEPTDPSPTVPYDPPAPPSVPPPGPATPAQPPAASGSAPLPPLAPPPTVRSRRDDPGRTGTIIFGLILVAIGLWFFADETLGLEMPRLRISELWPLILIVIGGWILLSSMRRGS